MTFRAITITPEPVITEEHWTFTDEATTLAHLQHACGGRIDVIALTPSLDLWIPDEGLYDGSPVNPVATTIAALHGHTHRPYYGTAVLTGGPDPTGTTTPLAPGTAARLLTLARSIARHTTAGGAVLLLSPASAQSASETTTPQPAYAGGGTDV